MIDAVTPTAGQKHGLLLVAGLAAAPHGNGILPGHPLPRTTAGAANGSTPGGDGDSRPGFRAAFLGEADKGVTARPIYERSRSVSGSAAGGGCTTDNATLRYQ